MGKGGSLFSRLPEELRRAGRNGQMGNFSGRTSLNTGKPCVGVPNIAPVQKAAWLRKPGMQSGSFRSIYIHTFRDSQ